MRGLIFKNDGLSYGIGLLFALLVTSAGLAQAGEPQQKLVLDLWDAAYLQGARAGYVHTYVQEFTKDGARLWRATMELRLAVKRSGETIQLGMDAGTVETPGGKVVGTFLKHYLGKSKTLEINGVVDDKMLRLTLDRGTPLKPAPWNADVVGLARQQRLLQERDVKPGDELSFQSFEPSINLVVKTVIRVKDYEEVELFGSKRKKRLLRVESRAEKIQNLQLPTLVSWLGDDLMPQRAEADIPPFGRIILYRTTKANALSPSAVAKLVDINISQHVRLTQRIPQPYETTKVLYHITIRDEEDPGSVFVKDDRQQVQKIRGTTVDLLVDAQQTSKKTPKPAAEFTKSSYFINSADSHVKELAKRAVGSETDSWKKALRIEQWVNLHMKVTSDEALAPADHVARTLRGDCTEFAMLMAAMCRAEAIPSRTALGLIYADLRTGPIFAFHMWTEVWVSGRWIPLDATLGKGHVGATHLKISDHSWDGTYDQAPLLPVFRVLGRLAIEVVPVAGSNR